MTGYELGRARPFGKAQAHYWQGPSALSGQLESFDRDYFAPWSSTYFHRRVLHMIVFSRPPGRKRRADDVWTSSSVTDARRRPRKTTLGGGLAGPYALVARSL